MRDFELQMPLLSALRNSALRDRHWDEFNRMSSLGYRPSFLQTFEGVINEHDFEPHLETLQAIVDVATKEAKRMRV